MSRCPVAAARGPVRPAPPRLRTPGCPRPPRLALRKGDYYIGAYLGNENAIHLYSEAPRIALLSVSDSRPEPGLVDLPHQWRIQAGHADE